MRSLNRIHGGIASCVLILGTTTILFSQDVQHQKKSGDHSAAPVQQNASSPRTNADSAQENHLKAGEHLDNSAVSLAGSQNATPPSAGEQPTSPLWPQAARQTNGEEEQRLQHAVGTAVAPPPAVLPIAAAEPTGIAIAPAKQRRVGRIVLKVGALVGASAALSTVLILSETTGSKPAGAR